MTLATVYAFLTFATFPIPDVISAIDPAKGLKLTMIVYYFLWVWGLNHDTDLQEIVYAAAPAEGKLRPSDKGVIVLIILVSLSLVWAIGSEQRFAAILAIFIAVNVFAWRWLLAAIRPAIVESKEIYRAAPQDFFSLERLDAFVEYISGHWQWLRFGAMGLVLAVLNAVVFFDDTRVFLASTLTQIYPKISIEQFSAILPLGLFIVFTMVEEGWIWIMRLKTDLVIAVTSDLEEKYQLRPRS